jgi:hypothetical protein
VSACVWELQKVLGQRVVAHAVHSRSCQRIGRWARGKEPIPEETYEALIDLRLTMDALLEWENEQSVRAWFTSLNLDLGDRAPIDVFRAGDRRAVWHAAQAFLNM